MYSWPLALPLIYSHKQCGSRHSYSMLSMTSTRHEGLNVREPSEQRKPRRNITDGGKTSEIADPVISRFAPSKTPHTLFPFAQQTNSRIQNPHSAFLPTLLEALRGFASSRFQMRHVITRNWCASGNGMICYTDLSLLFATTSAESSARKAVR
jgi:hypothetical protein